MTQVLARSSLRPTPQKIIVPRKHRQVLIEPPPAELQAALASASALPADGNTPFGRSLEQLRAQGRRHLLDQATRWAEWIGAPAPSAAALERPWVITGHQVEFYHAGVWAKVLAADVLAKRVGGGGGGGGGGEGIAFDLLVDHDTVDHLGFDLPVQVGNSWQRKTVEWAPASSVPADGLFAPTREQFERWDAEIGRYPLAQTDSLAFFLSALRPHGENIPYTQWLSKARAAFERAMNVHVHHVPTSLLCSGEIWQMFVRAWAEHAEEWIPLYNKHLAAYRARQGIKNPQHPMPDLAMTGDMRELPFWTYVPGQPRERLVVRKGADPFGAIAAEAVIRPRALALTMFVRLFFADMFIHGIGGALYDQITDELLRDLVGVVPPYGCVSAAWLLPLGQPLENTDDIAALKWRRHHAAHNPQLAIDPFTALKTDVAELIRDRRVLVEQIGSSLATARNDSAARRQRRECFDQLHALNAALHAKAPRLLANLDHQIADALRAREENKVLLWREYFFGLHSMESLQKLIAGVKSR
ncbi:MAG TPA: hypothetical protein VM008_08070 [Phycisphaerae bacterium]|nr:hypothetical protein [Phycisphaerae bacterium]